MNLFSCWRKKQVVNLCDGKCLGIISDIDIDPCDGRILAIVVPNNCGILGIFGNQSDYVIPWYRIKKIGDDVIMVDISDNNMATR